LIFSCSSESKNQITIAASANTQYVLNELVTTFEKENSINCEVILGSSGKLTAQIEAGAPYSIFLSANAKYPNYLINKSNLYGTPKTYALGKIALFSTTIKSERLIESLTSDKIKKIAIPNPKTAPYGIMAKEYLEKIGVYEKIKHKLVYGESILQTNQFVISGAAEIGFTSISTISSNVNVLKNIHWTPISDSLYTPLEQQLLILDTNKATDKFAQFMLSNPAKKVLKQYGYGIVD